MHVTPCYLLSLVGCCTGNLSEQDVECLRCGEACAPVSISQGDGVCGPCAKLSIHYKTCHTFVYQLTITSYCSYCDSLCLFHILWVGCFQSAQKHQSHPPRRPRQRQCRSRSWSRNPASADKHHQTPEAKSVEIEKPNYFQKTTSKYQSITPSTLKPNISVQALLTLLIV